MRHRRDVGKKLEVFEKPDGVDLEVVKDKSGWSVRLRVEAFTGVRVEIGRGSTRAKAIEDAVRLSDWLWLELTGPIKRVEWIPVEIIGRACGA